MYFSVITTLACAAFSIAAPLSAPVDVNGAKNKVEHTLDKVRRDVPAAPAPPTTPIAPLEVTLTNLATDLKAAVVVLVDSIDAKVSVQVDAAEVKAALVDVATVVASYTDKIKESAGESVENVKAEVVAGLLAEIISTVFMALSVVAKAGILVNGVFTTVASIIISHLVTVITIVTTAVPAALALVVTQIKPIGQTIVELNGLAVFNALGVESPFA